MPVQKSVLRSRYSRICLGERRSLHGPGFSVTISALSRSSPDTRRRLLRVARIPPCTAPFAAGETVPYHGPLVPADHEGIVPLLFDNSGAVAAGFRQHPARGVVFGFDPIESLWRDSRVDAGPRATAGKCNWDVAV